MILPKGIINLLKSKGFTSSKIQEANLQAELYRELVNKNINCLLELKSNKCRFDIVVFTSKWEPVLIIEIKNVRKRNKEDSKRKQVQKYEKFGLPVIVCISYTEIKTISDNIEELIYKSITHKTI